MSQESVAGTYVGIDGLERQQADLDEGWEEIRLEPIEFVDAGDRIVTIFAGVEVGRRGGFELVIGVDRRIHTKALREHGADVVVSDPGELRVSAGAGGDR